MPDTPKTNDENVVIEYEDQMTGAEIDETLTKLLNQSTDGKFTRYTMRLFGVPFQFSKYTDYRTYEAEGDSGGQYKNIGRKFTENIFMEAPIITIIPGKPKYLPAAKNKRQTSRKLLEAANGAISSLTTLLNITDDEAMVDKMRYYDFQQDYIHYMQYVNVMCQSAAAFLDLTSMEDATVDDNDPLITYDWKNYRYNATRYSTASGNILRSGTNYLTSVVDALKTYGPQAVNIFYEGHGLVGDTGTVTAFNEVVPQDMLEDLENVLTQLNYVSFYVDASSSSSESADNTTAQSRIAAAFESGQELFKEIAFVANSAGIDAQEFQDYVGGAADALNETLLGNREGAIGGILSRVLSAGSNVIKGDNMIFPEIYQSSKYSKSYNVTISLQSPYGNKIAYFINVLVPLFHLICLVIPKQSTANTYGSPFLVKAYYPGVFSCNLGIVSSIQIDKSSTGDGWTVDGFPAEIKVTLTITDLYSDLTMSGPGEDSFILFLANSSLIEYIATNCGIDLVSPQLTNRVKNVLAVVSNIPQQIEDTVTIEVLNGLENIISTLTGV